MGGEHLQQNRTMRGFNHQHQYPCTECHPLVFLQQLALEVLGQGRRTALTLTRLNKGKNKGKNVHPVACPREVQKVPSRSPA